jgi:hypothetical protein
LQLNLTGTYAKTSDNAQNAGGLGGIALILVILLIIYEVAKFILGMRKKPSQPSLPPIMGSEAKAKADKTATDNANATALAELRKKQGAMDEKAKVDKMTADPQYKVLMEKINKKAPKAKKLGIPIESLPEYKELQELASKHEIKLTEGSLNGK